MEPLEPQKKKTVQRMAAEDFATAEAVFKAAWLMDEPDELSQRKLFEKLLPLIHINRKRGYSFQKITKFLHAARFTLQLSTVKQYYYEMITDRHELIQKDINDHLLILNDINKLSGPAKNDAQSWADLATKHKERISRMATNKVSASLDVDYGYVQAAKKPALAAPSPATPKPANKTTAPKPVSSYDDSAPAIPSIPASNSLLSSMFDDLSGDGPVTKASMEPEAIEPETEVKAPAAASKLTVCKLQPGIKPFPKKEGVPPEVYLEGSLEHPAIPGLMLSMKERIYSAILEYTNEDGEILTETANHKTFRYMWKHPVIPTKSSTEGDFKTMNNSLFARNEH